MEQENKRNQFLSELVLALEPLAELLANCGVTRIEFEQVTSEAYGKLTTDHSLNRKTPLSDGESLRTPVSSDSEAGQESIADSATLILQGWHNDADFLQRGGRPAALTFATGNPCFSDLVEKYAPHQRPAEILQILILGGAIDSDELSKFYPKDYHFIPDKISVGVASMLKSFLGTVAFNSRPGKKLGETRRAHRFVFAKVPNEMVEDVRADFRARVIGFTEQINGDISEIEKASVGLHASTTKLIGISAFVYED